MAIDLALMVAICFLDLRVFDVALVARFVDGALANGGVTGHCDDIGSWFEGIGGTERVLIWETSAKSTGHLSGILSWRGSR